MGKKLTQSYIINKFKDIHLNEYDYSLVDYKNNRTKVSIICSKHGTFEQSPKSHLNGSGCPMCNLNIMDNDTFIKKIINIHGNKYDYSLVDYNNIRTKINIICPEHGIFSIRPDHILYDYKGCYKCNNKKKFIKKSQKLNGIKYDYSLVEYNNSHKKVKIICEKHGIFNQYPYHHLNGSGCPSCNESKGEKEVKDYLDKLNIKYIKQYTFNDCKFKRLLRFDFYLPDYNTCIEYDGEQHYMVKEIWGGEKEFNNIQKRDNIKNEYCLKNNIHLIRINYNDKNKLQHLSI